MLYDVYVQGRPYKSIEAKHTHEVLNQINADLENDRVPGRDPTKPPRIVIRPAHLPPLTATAVDDLFDSRPNTPPAPEPAPPSTPAVAPSAPANSRARSQLRAKK